MTRIGLLLGIVLPACATLNAEHVLTGTPGPPFAGEVKIVMEGSPISAPYQEVAIVSATGQGAHALLPAILGALQSEAARLGCNAVSGRALRVDAVVHHSRALDKTEGCDHFAIHVDGTRMVHANQAF